MNSISSFRLNIVLPWQQSHVLVNIKNIRQEKVDQSDEGIFCWAIGIFKLFWKKFGKCLCRIRYSIEFLWLNVLGGSYMIRLTTQTCIFWVLWFMLWTIVHEIKGKKNYMSTFQTCEPRLVACGKHRKWSHLFCVLNLSGYLKVWVQLWFFSRKWGGACQAVMLLMQSHARRPNCQERLGRVCLCTIPLPRWWPGGCARDTLEEERYCQSCNIYI